MEEEEDEEEVGEGEASARKQKTKQWPAGSMAPRNAGKTHGFNMMTPVMTVDKKQTITRINR